MKISSDQAHEQDCISKLRSIRANNVNNVFIGTLNINDFLASILDEFKLIVSRISDILIITKTNLHHTFPTSQFYIEYFPIPCRLDRNRNGSGILIYVREDIPAKVLAKHNLAEDLERIFLEISFEKSK